MATPMTPRFGNKFFFEIPVPVMHRVTRVFKHKAEDVLGFNKQEMMDFLNREFDHVGIPLCVNLQGEVAHITGYAEGVVEVHHDGDETIWMWTGDVVTACAR